MILKQALLRFCVKRGITSVLLEGFELQLPTPTIMLPSYLSMDFYKVFIIPNDLLNKLKLHCKLHNYHYMLFDISSLLKIMSSSRKPGEVTDSDVSFSKYSSFSELIIIGTPR